MTDDGQNPIPSYISPMPMITNDHLFSSSPLIHRPSTLHQIVSPSGAELGAHVRQPGRKGPETTNTQNKHQRTSDDHSGVLIAAAEDVGILEVTSLSVGVLVANHWNQSGAAHRRKSHLQELTHGATKLDRVPGPLGIHFGNEATEL